MEKFHLELKFKSITMRWFINVFAIVAIVAIAVAVAFSVVFSSVYTERVRVLAQDYAYEFYALESSSRDTFEDSAITLASTFPYKSQVEVQVIDHNDNPIVSTTGFLSEKTVMPDYEKAKQTGTSQNAKSKTENGETVLAETVPLYSSDGTFLGSYRWVVSMESLNRQTTSFAIVSALVVLLVLAVFGFSGFFFIRSIVNPIKDVSNIARKIAMGNLDSRIEIYKNDEIGELCDSINYMASELVQAQNLKNDFISSVSHELRTPLTAIRGWGETAKMSVGTDNELVNRGLDVVLSEADRLSGLVEELLDFSRIETGRLSVLSQPVDVYKILAAAADMYIELSKKNGIEFIFNRPTEQLQVLGDSDRLKQVFINIIDNAIKYTESGGQVLITHQKEEGCVRIAVADTGVGIPASDIDRVKEKFYKANKTVRGSGIGLALADEIIKQHHGLLFIESVEGAGTTVTVVLPLYEPPEEPEKPNETQEEAVALTESTEEIQDVQM